MNPKHKGSPDTRIPLPQADIKDRICNSCSRPYLGGTICPNCKGIGKSLSDDNMMRKTFDPPDLLK